MKAAVLTAVNQPLEIREITWRPPGHGQVLVKILTTGICGAQLAEIRGEKGAHFPRLLGHEASAEVLEIGHGVTTVSVGDRVVCHWRKGDGVESLPPLWTDDFSDLRSVIVGTHEFKTAGQVTTFLTDSVISENRLTRVPNDTPVDLCALLGCGLSTALGTMENEANLKFGETVLIVGCGGLGLNLILAAKLRQAGTIIVADVADKSEVAYSMGANYFFSLVGEINFAGVRPEIDVVIDTTGNPYTMSKAMEYLAPSGRFIMVGQPKTGEGVIIPNTRSMFDGTGKTILATQGGRFSPSKDIPRYVQMWRNGSLNIDGLITHRFPFFEINAGLDVVRSGQAGRVMIDCADQ